MSFLKSFSTFTVIAVSVLSLTSFIPTFAQSGYGASNPYGTNAGGFPGEVGQKTTYTASSDVKSGVPVTIESPIPSIKQAVLTFKKDVSAGENVSVDFEVQAPNTTFTNCTSSPILDLKFTPKNIDKDQVEVQLNLNLVNSVVSKYTSIKSCLYNSPGVDVGISRVSADGTQSVYQTAKFTTPSYYQIYGTTLAGTVRTGAEDFVRNYPFATIVMLGLVTIAGITGFKLAFKPAKIER